MPYVIEGQLVVGLDKLRAHAGHALTVMHGVQGDADPIELWCETDETLIEREYTPRPRLACGCTDKAEHNEGVAIQEQERKAGGIPRAACVGCYIGDDGPSVHSCVIHERRYWA